MVLQRTTSKDGTGRRPMTLYRTFLVSIAVSVMAVLAACVSPDTRFQIGERHDPLLLDSALEIGVSTRSDVLRVIGKPHGEGRSMLPGTTTPQPTWTYYYEAGTLKDARRQFLWVYFDGDLYDGYMWFSSFGGQLAAAN